jgi:malonyl CoA-acyl carrier protein transacylase/nucleoside-diphosphate-sugar epimerase/acyl carrier protein
MADSILHSTAVHQNDNSTPVFVPNAPSLSRLFVDVVRQAGLKPQDISLVEAHGTGTPVGDPAEYQSIRQALAGPIRTKTLPVGSVKGLVGHTESTSGVVSLIKVLALMHESFIPPQPNFSKLSHRINASPTDMIEVPTTLRPWNETQKVALINNYGASGSNASIVVRQTQYNGFSASPIHSCARQPFWITGFDARSIEAYCKKLAQFVKQCRDRVSLADIAFNIARQSNRALSHGMSFSCGQVSELIQKISSSKIEHREIKPSRPVILCFGGQVSTFIGLDRKVYDSVKLLRKHLDECNAIIQSLGLEGIFPSIFSKTPISDPVKLQTMLFALQYACAKSWIESGVKVEALVGHSFGEIAALCVSGVLTLVNTVKLIAARARIIRGTWGSDPGAMMAVEGDLNIVHTLLSRANRTYQGDYPATIACYNGTQSFTLAGSSEAMAIVEKSISTTAEFSCVKSKRLNVANAFHSTLVEPLLPALEQIGKEIEFNDPIIPLERATEVRPASFKVSSDFFAHHMRRPVFFSHAVQRLAKEHPACIWLEAGSASTITVMANRTLGSSPDMHFQALNVTNGGSMENLADTTVSLWNEGLRVAFWAHHGVQTDEYKPLLLPPYQFEKARHWLEFKPFENAFISQQRSQTIPSDAAPPGLWTFTGYQDLERRRARFRINTDTEKYQKLVSGHVVVQTAPICPATVEIDMAIEALLSLLSDSDRDSNLHPIVRGVQNHVSLCVDPAREVWLDLSASEESWRSCTWKIVTTPVNNQTAKDMLCVEGRIELRSTEDALYRAEFARFERLVNYEACADLLHDTAGVADDILQGRNIYRAFSEVVDYDLYYQGVRRVVGRQNECAGKVQLQHSPETWLNVPLSDSCSQVAGLWVNCMTDRNPENIFLATGCKIVIRSPRTAEDERPDTHHVFARHHRESDKTYMTDVFFFNPESKRLIEVLSGIQYSRVAKASLSRILTRLTGDQSCLRSKPDTTTERVHSNATAEALSIETSQCETAHLPLSFNHTSPNLERPDIRNELRLLIANICGVEAGEIGEESEMADLGIDSLMSMEISREVENKFGCKLDQMELLDATSFGKFVVCISRALYGVEYDPGDDSREDGDTCSHNGSTIFSDVMGEANSVPTTVGPGSPVIHPTEFESSGAKAVIGPTFANGESSTLQLSSRDILSAFGEVQWSTDQRLRDAKLDNTDSSIVACSSKLCVALIVEVFEELGCPLHAALPGQILDRISYQPQHNGLVNWLYDFLSNEARLIDIEGSTIVRTDISTPRKSSATVYQELLQTQDTWVVAHKLAYFAGKHLAEPAGAESSQTSVVVTGGTGSLGAHLVAAFTSRLDIMTVICLNRRRGSTSATIRQQEALASRGIVLSQAAEAKLKVFEIDANKPYFGLPGDQYAFLINGATHIIHNAWPMSGTRQVRAFEPQFLMLRKMLDLAAASNHHSRKQVTFQFISSIGVVGLYSIDGANPEVPETRVPISFVPQIGYCEAKWTCERILDETLRRHPMQFRAMVVRPGQIAGSRTSGYWNPVEHFAFLVKSAQTLRAFPALHGRLQWVPVDDVAATVVDLAMRDGEAFPVYHIDNPVGQPWEEIVPLLVRELGISGSDGTIVSFEDWIRRVRRSPLSMETDNPALRLVHFLEDNFERMSCGGLILGTERARNHSATLATMGPVPPEVVRGYMRAWKDSGFLRR